MKILISEASRTLTAAFALTAITFLSPSESLAQFGPGGEYDAESGKSMQPSDAQRDKAEAAGYDDNILADYWPYFEYARKNNGGSCCGFKDAMIVDPEDVQEADDAQFPYRVLIRRTSSGLELAEPYWLSVPSNQVLDQKQSAKICEAYNEKAEAENIDAFCSVPPFPVVFVNDGTFYSTASRTHWVSGRHYPSGHILKPEEIRSYAPAQYCFQPAPTGF